MACKIADNKPLDTLRKDLGLPAQCHSSRGHCALSKKTRNQVNTVMGGPGAAIGYCQGLFSKNGNPKQHTKSIVKKLSEIQAPWFKSHELYWNYRENEEVHKYIEDAIEPLLGEGRVPILITSLDPANDEEIIKEILISSPRVVEGETILFRWSLHSDESIKRAARLIQKSLAEVRSKKEMPKWWPLLQGSLHISEWNQLKQQLGDDWKYVNLAVNPFSDQKLLTTFPDQVTVAQFVVGEAKHIYKNGDIIVNGKIDVGLTKDDKKYNIFSYAQSIRDANIMPMSIICGPSLGWSDKDNKRRVEKLMSLYKQAVKALWHKAKLKGREEILGLAA